LRARAAPKKLAGMSDDPGFGVSRQAVLDLAHSLEVDSLADAFPAALLAPVWRALLEGGTIEAPTRVDLDGVEVIVTAPNWLELRVPVRSRHGEPVSALPVWVEAWTTPGNTLAEQLVEEAESLAQALEMAASLPTFDHYPGSAQKPKN
jgi:hypothetical protein